MPTRPYTVEGLLRRAGDLPAMPHVTQRALALIRTNSSSMAELADVLALDQAMAGLVLRWANSAYYSLRSPVATVRQAVVYLGHSAIKSLLLAASIATYLERPTSPSSGASRPASSTRRQLPHPPPSELSESMHWTP